MPKIDSVDELRQWLSKNGIAATHWGAGGTKTVKNLWAELVNGEIQLLDSPPSRVVQVVEISIRHGGYLLKELEQEFGNGQRRSRNRLPSEKMRFNESCTSAALRCLIEEIGVDKEDISSIRPGNEPLKKLVDSPSYPGLLTQYTFFPVVARVRSLPDTDFWRENAAYAHGDPIKRHHWAWVAE